MREDLLSVLSAYTEFFFCLSSKLTWPLSSAPKNRSTKKPSGFWPLTSGQLWDQSVTISPKVCFQAIRSRIFFHYSTSNLNYLSVMGFFRSKMGKMDRYRFFKVDTPSFTVQRARDKKIPFFPGEYLLRSRNSKYGKTLAKDQNFLFGI